MSACLAAHELARFATEGGTHVHLDDCLVCRGALRRQASVRALVQRATPSTVLPLDERRWLAARIVAAGRAIDFLPALAKARPQAPRRAVRAIAATAFAAAAAVAVVAAARRPAERATVPSLAVEVAPERAAARYAFASADDAPPLPADPIVDARGARVTQAMRGDRAVFALAEGMLEVDARHARDTDIVVGALRIAVVDARVRVRAHAGSVTNVQVIVGAARIEGPGVHVTLERESLWEPSATRADEAAAAASARAFAAGWVAWREGRDRDAIALFDRATDPAVAEEAAYWAAQAAMRAGDRDDAARRFAHFLATYPDSPYAARARRARRAMRAKESLGSRD